MHVIKGRPQAKAEPLLTAEVTRVTRKIIEGWKSPDFQRPVSLNSNLVSLAKDIRNKGTLLTAIYLGVKDGKVYLVDGQHRCTAFLMSELEEVEVVVITKHYPGGYVGLVEMCNDFLIINKSVKNPTANDKLRALEPASEGLQRIRKECPFVGYAGFKRQGDGPFLSMAQVIRAMVISGQEVPGSAGSGAVVHASEMSKAQASGLVTFLNVAYKAWGRDAEYRLLWSPMNMALCLWFFRRMLRGPSAAQNSGNVSQAQFLNIFYALLANKRYYALLQSNSGGRMNSPEVKNPVAKELLKTMRDQLKRDGATDPYIPQPLWPGF